MACVIEELFRPHQTSCIIPHTLGTGKASDQTQLLKVSSPFIYCNKFFFSLLHLFTSLKNREKKKLTLYKGLFSHTTLQGSLNIQTGLYPMLVFKIKSGNPTVSLLVLLKNK